MKRGVIGIIVASVAIAAVVEIAEDDGPPTARQASEATPEASPRPSLTPTRKASPTPVVQSTKPATTTPPSPASERLNPPAVPAAPVRDASSTLVLAVVDGDTIETPEGTVRLIGIDTPERGECNYNASTLELEYALAAHDNSVVLTPAPGEDADKYGRLL